MTVLATVASTIWNSANRSPLAVGPKMPTTIVTMITASRKPGRVAHAASGMIAHSRYQGCTTGNSNTVPPSATPRPPTGCSRPRKTDSSSQATMTRDDQDADATGQRQHGGGVIAQTQQNPDLPGAQRDQRRRRHPAAHHVGGAERVDPAESQPAGRADGRHHRQRQRRHRGAGQQERLDGAAIALRQRHRDEAQCQQRRQLDLRRQHDQDRPDQQHAQRRPVRPVATGPRPRSRPQRAR